MDTLTPGNPGRVWLKGPIYGIADVASKVPKKFLNADTFWRKIPQSPGRGEQDERFEDKANRAGADRGLAP